jgi:hypothetical protein
MRSTTKWDSHEFAFSWQPLRCLFDGVGGFGMLRDNKTADKPRVFE